jgi:hypothetical protein
MRAMGWGLGFDAGRILPAPVLILVAVWMKSALDLRLIITCLVTLFVFRTGVVGF